ncbi:hypothetical protein CU098_002780 [Rhizopus stolonifer]|uniref:Uncharacterized protein n=1 Tax=Rhizopus stolonifer TaxID=4846 RepID=A0A367IRN8_RHIST|nr:hypothetical protein CU098_002780 [Rhizopus stolonifer]
MSKSYQLDVESDNPRPLESYRYLIETFYIKSVIARFSCKIALALPNEFSGEPTKAPDIIKKHFKIPKDAPLVESVESSLQKILDEFKEFNQQNCHNWSPLQIYTLDLSYLFYRICITFVHSNTLSQNDHRHTFILYDLHSLKPLDLTNVKNILDINKVLPESFEVIDKSLVYLRNFDVHSEQSDFLSRGIVISSIDAAAQVLMYSYQVAPTDKVRHYLELAETILTMPVIWFKWETAEIIKNAITEFLTMHPPLTLNDNALLSLNSFSPMSSSATSSDFNDTPWFTNEGNWVQDLNSIFTFHDLNVPMQLFQSEEQTSLSEQDLSAILTDLL